jgi:SAM-dependent methyltransferase
MIEILLWIFVIVGYSIAFFLILRVYVVGLSFHREAPYVPLYKSVAKEALKHLNLKEGDRFVDIGSGDGLICFMASKQFKGKVVGVEIGKFLVFLSRFKNLFLRRDIQFIQSDMFKLDYSQYNKVFLYLTTDLISELIPKLENEIPKGAVVVSSVFDFGDEFMNSHNVKVVEYNGGLKKRNIYVWQK